VLLFHSRNDEKLIGWKYIFFFLLASQLTAFKKISYVGDVAANIWTNKSSKLLSKCHLPFWLLFHYFLAYSFIVISEMQWLLSY